MEKRSIIYFQERRNASIAINAVIYQECNGSLEGVGHALACFLEKVLLVSTMEIGPEAESRGDRIVCYGFGDLVARFVKKLKKDKRGDFYLHPATADQKESIIYYVTNTREGIVVQIQGMQCENVTLERSSENHSRTIEMCVDDFIRLCKLSGMYDIQCRC